MTAEFELLKNDPDLETTRGPGGTLIFIYGDQYCVVGQNFTSVEESDDYAFGSTREQAIANYAMKNAQTQMELRRFLVSATVVEKTISCKAFVYVPMLF